MPVLFVAVAVPAVTARAAHQQAFCPKQQSVVMSTKTHALYAWLQRETTGTIIHLCWTGDERRPDAVHHWLATAEDTGQGRRVAFTMLALTTHTAIGSANLTAGRNWLLTFELRTASGVRPVLSTTVRI
ncbi:hypothetical protein [Plantactinospora sp. KBS50]|uniref:hypothetical protein n=1 Tax=Plantactinospora sp. KBS50 TaxID=2024580 RepID=UPI0012FD3D40|nr:hypothetical protein [Plantactinospora sp. KBS50]